MKTPTPATRRPSTPRAVRWPATPVALVAAGLAAGGCNKGDEEPAAETGRALQGSRTEGGEQAREDCRETGNTVSTDVNNDGTPDIYHTSRDGRRRCTEIDMNFDGRIDVVRFYEDDGETPRREEHDFDFDGRLDQVAFYEGGELTRKELDTNFDNRVDTWMWCEDGLVARAERDRHNNGRPDTWEVYQRGRLAQARYDDNNDGRPEKWEIFEDGRLAYVLYDADQDGEQDQREEISRADAGERDQPISCDGRPVEDLLTGADDGAGVGGGDFDDVETTPTPEAGDGDGEAGDGEAEEGPGEEPMPEGQERGEEAP